MLLFCAFAVDLGYICLARTEAQRAADAAAIAATWQLVSEDYANGENIEQIHDRVRATAAAYVSANPVAGASTFADRNLSNSAGGDIVLGRIDDPRNVNDFATVTWARYNAVTVRVRRDADHGGRAPLFFAAVLGTPDTEAYAEATAMFRDNIRGFRITRPHRRCSLMPFVVHESTWQAWLNGEGSDGFSYDPDSGTVSSGGDAVREFTLFADGNGDGDSRDNGAVAPGNFGTVDIGNTNNSASDLKRQIRYGPNQADLERHDGELVLRGTSNTLSLNGDTGITASIQDALADVVGMPRTIMLYREVSDNGNNAYYTIVGFVGVRLVDYSLTDSNKYLRVQPAMCVDDTAVATDSGWSSSWFIGQPVQLVR
jgi:hypothetical protein